MQRLVLIVMCLTSATLQEHYRNSTHATCFHGHTVGEPITGGISRLGCISLLHSWNGPTYSDSLGSETKVCLQAILWTPQCSRFCSFWKVVYMYKGTWGSGRLTQIPWGPKQRFACEQFCRLLNVQDFVAFGRWFTCTKVLEDQRKWWWNIKALINVWWSPRDANTAW